MRSRPYGFVFEADMPRIVCYIEAAERRLDQYGFGDDPDSDLLVTMNMTEEMLDDAYATHTKPVENYYGNLDRELQKSGPQGFNKSTDDLIINYSKYLIDDGYKWHTKANRKLALQLHEKQCVFDKKQKQFSSKTLDDADVTKLNSGNRRIKIISTCKKSHGGPITTIEEVENLI